MKKSLTMTQPLIDQYGVINGDNDIIHYDHDYAVERGFRGTLAHGLHVMGYAVDLASKKYGKDWYDNGEIYVKWVAPVCPGDNLEVEIADDGSLKAKVQSGDVMIGHAKITKSA
jgi:acyl dehydratase